VYVVSLNNEADNSNRIKLLGAGKCGADKNVHELQGDKRKALLGSKGDEVYLAGNKKSRVTHEGVIGRLLE
jgi:hypothetical protein